jgi:DNA-binding MarR family transcriptional regulator
MAMRSRRRLLPARGRVLVVSLHDGKFSEAETRHGGQTRYDLVQRTDNDLRVYYGVTEDGIHGPWRKLVEGDERTQPQVPMLPATAQAGEPALTPSTADATLEPVSAPQEAVQSKGPVPLTELWIAVEGDPLLLQLRHLGLEGTPTEKVVTDHLRLLQNHQVPEIARKLGLTIDDLKEHIEVIRNLDPKPGSRYNPTQSQYVIPDVYVIKVEDQYVAVLNEDGLPQMRISPVYRRLLDKGATENNDETRAYVRDKFRSALWLIKSVEQRQKTIHKVANSIITFQRDFLDHGIEHLRPLVLRDVANDIGMHESTVSRVVNNKYMHTHRGLFPMKFFFHSGIDREYGDNISSLTVKRKIQQLIQGEDPRRPLSDSDLMRVLNREGINIARRTVAKYREVLGVLPSSKRKKYF